MIVVFVRLFLLLCVGSIGATEVLLPSWNEGATKNCIIDFLSAVTDKNNPDYVAPEERVAVFDQDGTLWVEQPIPPEFLFTFDRIRSLAPLHPEWQTVEPYKSILARDTTSIIRNMTSEMIAKIMAITHSGMTTEVFGQIVKEWLDHAVDPRFKKHYTELVYKPMIEVVDLLKKNEFSVYIVSGGSQDFIRVYSEKVYRVPPENVIGTTGKTRYEYIDGQPVLMKLPEVLFIDNMKGKPESINLFIGRRPLAAFGNSTGDQQMLEWTQAGKGRRLELLVYHDDPIREYDYGPESKIGTFSEALMSEAVKKGWIVVSMKNDWKVIFP